jgi:hypothetical protein
MSTLDAVSIICQTLASGALAAPAHLYDPRIAELGALLDAETAFPAPPFSDEVVLASLTALGLRSTVTQVGLGRCY